MASDPQSSSESLHEYDSVSTLHGEDAENQKHAPPKFSHWRLVFSQSLVTDDVVTHPYRGSGTDEDPYLVEFIPNDPRNPMNWKDWKKWAITLDVAIATLAVAFVSTAYTGSIVQIIEEFHCSKEVATLGVSTPESPLLFGTTESRVRNPGTAAGALQLLFICIIPGAPDIGLEH